MLSHSVSTFNEGAGVLRSNGFFSAGGFAWASNWVGAKAVSPITNTIRAIMKFDKGLLCLNAIRDLMFLYKTIVVPNSKTYLNDQNSINRKVVAEWPSLE